MAEVIISSVNQVLEIIEELNETYETSPLVKNPATMRFVFRGVIDDQYSLLPNVLRKVTNKTGIDSTPKYVWGREDVILTSFIAEASSVIKDILPSERNKWAEYAQHFGVPTRYLDWTKNPLIALYFACSCSSKAAEETDAALWVLHAPNYANYYNGKNNEMSNASKYKDLKISEKINLILTGEPAFDYPLIYQPYYVDPRMVAQSSFFMVWGNKEEPLEEMITRDNFMIYSNKISSGRVFSETQYNQFVLKLTISKSEKFKILRELDMIGINEKMLFPGLDGIGKYIERKYRFDYKELLSL